MAAAQNRSGGSTLKGPDERRYNFHTMTPHWDHFQHGADVGVRGIGRTKEEAFEQAALALMAVILEKGSIVEPRQCVEVRAESPDAELLLADWLNAVVYEIAVRRMLFSRFEVRLDSERLHGQAWGEPLELGRHQTAVEVKGATYTELSVRHMADGSWMAQCVVDV
jgi:tRNA nucleotidyltransferase (CCA-adding enzyme)